MLEHGGALRTAVAHYGLPLGDWLDLSTGINPHGWPAPLVAYLDQRRAAFAHLAWDLGLDVHAGADGAPVIARTAVYATC